ncbi:MAG: ferritin-like domain-containing protein [Steroidobacteraceae bacterium]
MTDSSMEVTVIAEGEGSRDTAEVLDNLLTQSIHIRDLYQHARWQTSDIQFHRLRQIFDDHYREQIRLIDVLIDRIHMLGRSGGVFAREFVQSTQFCCALRGRKAPSLLLSELLNAHESVLGAARPSGLSEGHDWVRDFAVGQVVLANDFQSQCLSGELAGSRLSKELQCHW